ncbi:MAG: hypothetical protein PS018_20355 [bacterium]|nr:hypothetical protein [bacterium]
MTNEIEKEAAAAQGLADPVAAEDAALAKAIDGGYREPPPPSREQRAATLIADVEHAMQNNGPMTAAMLAEMRSLLLDVVG